MQPLISELGRWKKVGSGWKRSRLRGWDCAYAGLIPYRGFLKVYITWLAWVEISEVCLSLRFLPPRNFSLPPPSWYPAITYPFAGEFQESGRWRDLNLFRYGRELDTAGTSDSVASTFSTFSDLVSLRVPNLPAYPRYPNRFRLRHLPDSWKFPCKGLLYCM
jgi:hypothetical protein